MGSKIKAKYDGACKFCGEDWVVGDNLYYQKNPKAICSEESCFKQQGGTVSTYGFNKNADVIVTRIPDIEVGDSVKQVAENLPISLSIIAKLNADKLFEKLGFENMGSNWRLK